MQNYTQKNTGSIIIFWYFFALCSNNAGIFAFCNEQKINPLY